MASSVRSPRMTAVLRSEERVKPLELFFDLVFVLAITQCTALMADDPTWEGLARGLLILGVLWWSWVGYSWLTSVVDPEEGIVRFAIFGAMASLLVVALCVPEAFDDSALLFACAYGLVRAAHILLFLVASRDTPELRRAVWGLGGGTAIGVGLLVGASFADGALQGSLWALALLLDMGEPYLFGSEGWKLVPGHFAERHGLILIIALGESIVAIGVGAEGLDVDAGLVVAAALGVGAAAALWWLYFDIVALVAERRLSRAAPGREQNEIARDSFSYLHFPMVAGIVLLALGLKKTLEHVGDPLELVPAVAMLGGTALYLLAHVAFRWRNVHRFSSQRLLCAILLCTLVAAAVDLRDRMRHQLAGGG
jgi:low temperature requirement protein LtrA